VILLDRSPVYAEFNGRACAISACRDGRGIDVEDLMKIKTIAAALLAVCAMGSALASSPYNNPGTQNPYTYTFEATFTGDITATLVSADAAYNEYIFMGAWPSATPGPLNHDPVGTTLDLGHVTAGQIVTFAIYITGNGQKFWSTSTQNSDHDNHVWAKQLSDGVLIAFEDLPNGASDWDYNDAVYKLSGVAVVPEPANIALLLAGIGMVGVMARRRRSA
jgi:hypothetical protein